MEKSRKNVKKILLPNKLIEMFLNNLQFIYYNTKNIIVNDASNNYDIYIARIKHNTNIYNIASVLVENNGVIPNSNPKSIQYLNWSIISLRNYKNENEILSVYGFLPVNIQQLDVIDKNEIHDLELKKTSSVLQNDRCEYEFIENAFSNYKVVLFTSRKRPEIRNGLPVNVVFLPVLNRFNTIISRIL